MKFTFALGARNLSSICDPHLASVHADVTDDGAETDPCVQVVQIITVRALAGTADTLELPDEGLEGSGGR